MLLTAFDFQSTLEQAQYYFDLPAPEEKPFDFKYKSRELLQDILQKLQDNQVIEKMLVHFYLAQNFMETEENGQSYENNHKALKYLETIKNPTPYLNILQVIYNNLSFQLINREQLSDGIALLLKNVELYKFIQNYNLSSKDQIVHTVTSALAIKDSIFIYFIDGGIDLQQTESSYTMTLFYLAQAYTKAKLKDKAAHYCGQTMCRQYKSKQYEIKDWAVNCISLSDYYQENEQYAQALYLMQCGLVVVESQQKIKKKLVATLQMTLGRLMLNFLKFNVVNFDADNVQIAEKQKQINKEIFEFEDINVKFPVMKISQDIEGIKQTFRIANTCYKKALSKFIIDGYVTEHIQMQQDISKLYHYLSLLEKDKKNIIAFQDKRLEIINPILQQINPKAYQQTYEALVVEVADINNQQFETLFHINYVQNQPNKKQIEKMNKAAEITIQTYEKIVTFFTQQEGEKNELYYQNIVNAKFNVAKALSKMNIQVHDKKVKALVDSLQKYKEIIKTIKEAEQAGFGARFKEELKICIEMVELLPTKIDKINNQR